jgi:hypothetical protein
MATMPVNLVGGDDDERRSEWADDSGAVLWLWGLLVVAVAWQLRSSSDNEVQLMSLTFGIFSYHNLLKLVSYSAFYTKTESQKHAS